MSARSPHQTRDSVRNNRQTELSLYQIVFLFLWFLREQKELFFSRMVNGLIHRAMKKLDRLVRDM